MLGRVAVSRVGGRWAVVGAGVVAELSSAACYGRMAEYSYRFKRRCEGVCCNTAKCCVDLSDDWLLSTDLDATGGIVTSLAAPAQGGC